MTTSPHHDNHPASWQLSRLSSSQPSLIILFSPHRSLSSFSHHNHSHPLILYSSQPSLILFSPQPILILLFSPHHNLSSYYSPLITTLTLIFSPHHNLSSSYSLLITTSPPPYNLSLLYPPVSFSSIHKTLPLENFGPCLWKVERLRKHLKSMVSATDYFFLIIIFSPSPLLFFSCFSLLKFLFFFSLFFSLGECKE